MKTLVLGLGNDLLGDDAIGLLATRQLAAEAGDCADYVESAECGIALMEYLLDYDQAIILDAIHSGRHLPGTILELLAEELSPVTAPSPHYAGLPEMLALARALNCTIPRRITIIAMEVADPYTIGRPLTPAVLQALPEYVAQVRRHLDAARPIVITDISAQSSTEEVHYA